MFHQSIDLCSNEKFIQSQGAYKKSQSLVQCKLTQGTQLSRGSYFVELYLQFPEQLSAIPSCPPHSLSAIVRFDCTRNRTPVLGYDTDVRNYSFYLLIIILICTIFFTYINITQFQTFNAFHKHPEDTQRQIIVEKRCYKVLTL